MNAGIEQRRKIGRVEGLKTVGVYLAGAVTPIQPVVEEQPHLVDGIVGGHIEGIEQVGAAVRAQLGQRDLGAGNDHRLVQIFQHERQRGGGKRHGIGAVQHHKTVVVVVVGPDIIGNALPVGGRHVGRVDQRIIFVNMIGRHFRAMKLRGFGQAVGHEARLGHIAPGGFLHADGAAGVGDIDFFLVH